MSQDTSGGRDEVRTRLSGQVLVGQRRGNVRMRVSRPPKAERLRLPTPVMRRPAPHPALTLVLIFFALDAVGTLALMLPASTVSGESTPLIDAFFTATSAVCVTGLVVVDTASHWSGFGQAVILMLIQVGGLGIMTGSTLLLLLVGRRVTLRDRLLLKAALSSPTLGSTLELGRRVTIFTVITEAVGAAILTARFMADHDPGRALWMGVFHSISGFNNAGFDLMGGFRSLLAFSHDPIVLITCMVLIVMGGISYTVVEDGVRARRFARLTLDSKLVLVTTVALLMIGTVGLLVAEGRNPSTLGQMTPGPQLLNAVFQSVSARTAGFASIDFGRMSEPGLLVMMGLMIIGGAAGSTAGGIKVQAFAILCFGMISALRGHREVEAFERRVPVADLLLAISVGFLLVNGVFLTAFILSITHRFEFAKDLFEAVSAIATVGLSTGITPEINPLGRIVLAFTMLTGRLGPLALVLALTARERTARYNWPEESVKIG